MLQPFPLVGVHRRFEHLSGAGASDDGRERQRDVTQAQRAFLYPGHGEHTAFVASHNVWGVPTFVIDEKAVFVRLLDGSAGDGSVATRTVDRILDQVEWPLLNEFKHTSIPR